MGCFVKKRASWFSTRFQRLAGNESAQLSAQEPDGQGHWLREKTMACPLPIHRGPEAATRQQSVRRMRCASSPWDGKISCSSATRTPARTSPSCKPSSPPAACTTSTPTSTSKMCSSASSGTRRRKSTTSYPKTGRRSLRPASVVSAKLQPLNSDRRLIVY